MKRNYDRLHWTDFGRQLLSSKDLDPLYYVSQVSMPIDQLKRFLLAYWCYYSAGIAADISEAPSNRFFSTMLKVYNTAPRGHERRHFRGQAGRDAIHKMKKDWDNYPEAIVDYMTCAYITPHIRTVDRIIERVKDFYQFGDWIAWKVADMTERVLRYPVNFSGANLLIYKEPVKATGLMLYGDVKRKVSKDDIDTVVMWMLREFQDIKAPPDNARTINVQEVETIMCKWKAHVNGHYPLFNDTEEILTGLENRGETAKRIKKVIIQNVRYSLAKTLFNIGDSHDRKEKARTFQDR